ncbi:MAG TPA: cobalamin-dependent protein [Nocardioidaceae bacterium]|nr:cobalamin-dependent protein [Nocardioidaceae bacterium]
MTSTARADAATVYLDLLGSGDRASALAFVRELRASGMSALEVMNTVVAPAQFRIGELWAEDAWSVAQEHAATAVSEAVLNVLAADTPRPPADSSPVLVSCVEQEWHALAALLVAEHLRSNQMAVSYLGANASAEHLVRHIHAVGPRAVALSCSLSASLPRVRRQIEAVRETGTPVVVGGAAFDTEGRRAAVLGASGFARTGADAVRVVQDLPSAVAPAPPLTHPGADEAWIVHADRESIAAQIRQRVLEAHTLDDDTATGWRQALSDHLPHLVGSVAGALISDDPRVLHESLAWTDMVLDHRSAPDGLPAELRGLLAESMRELPVASRLCAEAPTG